MKKLYRIENKKGKHGMWRNFDGTVNPLLDNMEEDLPIKALPMPEDEIYRAEGKEWFSSTDDIEKLKHWFQESDVDALLAAGFEILELIVTDYKVLSEFEAVFTRDAIISERKINKEELFKKENQEDKKMKKDIKLLIDKYELTMNEVYIQNKETDEYSYYDAFFRKIPFANGYALTAGLDSVIKFIKDFRFDEDDIHYIRSLNTFSEEHIEYLKNFRFTGDIFAIPDGTPVFGNEPLMTIRANKIEANLFETIILSYLNGQIKFATATTKIMNAAGDIPIMEFGARRADSPEAAIDATKCAYMVGVAGTSNMAAGKLYGVPVMGTMAHSYVKDADCGEYEAFLKFAKVWPKDAIFLVDTFDTLNSGIPNAIRVAKDFLEPNGYKLKGIRLDSGNLLELSKEARRMLDEAGMEDTKIIVSNGLDAEAIKALRDANAPIDFIGLGDNIVAPKERVGVVYKLVGKEKDYHIIPKIKKSEDEFKTINPGYKKIYRLYDKVTKIPLGDVIANYDEQIPEDLYVFVDENGQEKVVSDYVIEQLQVPIFRNGELVYNEPTLEEKRAYCYNLVKTLPEEVKKIINPETYPVNISAKVRATKLVLIEEIENVKKIA